MKKKKEWWEYLDWSQMNATFKLLPKTKKTKILDNGYWSCGKGKFAGMEK